MEEGVISFQLEEVYDAMGWFLSASSFSGRCTCDKLFNSSRLAMQIATFRIGSTEGLEV